MTDSRTRRRALLPVLLVGLGAVAALAYVRGVDPHEPGHYPRCPFYALTGLYCAGCGSLRALHDLAHLDVAGAWDMNPLLVLALPLLGLGWLAWLRRAWSAPPGGAVPPPWAAWTVAAVLLGYSVARNVPALAPWLAP